MDKWMDELTDGQLYYINTSIIWGRERERESVRGEWIDRKIEMEGEWMDGWMSNYMLDRSIIREREREREWGRWIEGQR